jgi:hypothetical protein
MTTYPVTPGIPDKLTPLTSEQAAKALSDGYLLVTGKRPSKQILSLLIAQTASETGNWKSIHHYNFGNIRGVAPDGMWTSFRAGEIDPSGNEYFLEEDISPSSQNRFMAYKDAASGAKDYIKKLKDRPNWWNGLQTGTVEGFIKGLTTYPKYFTANPIAYQNLMANRVASYQALAKQYAAPTGIAAAVLAGIAGIVGFLTIRKIRQE